MASISEIIDSVKAFRACLVCFEELPARAGQYCSNECSDIGRVDSACWQAIESCIVRGILPPLNSRLKPAVPDPKDRYRIYHATYFQRFENRWHRIGRAGFRIGPEDYLVCDETPLHVPWPFESFLECSWPPQPLSLARLTAEQITDYARVIREGRIEKHQAMDYARAEMFSADDARTEAFAAKLKTDNAPPVIPSWPRPYTSWEEA